MGSNAAAIAGLLSSQVASPWLDLLPGHGRDLALPQSRLGPLAGGEHVEGLHGLGMRGQATKLAKMHVGGQTSPRTCMQQRWGHATKLAKMYAWEQTTSRMQQQCAAAWTHISRAAGRVL